jgi:DNA-binding NarL/FixJ family response regulator
MEKADTGLTHSPATDQEEPISLTTREREILRLVAEGLTNVEIARKLYLSDKTVKSHVSNILAKLHLPDRTQAAVFAYRHGLT